MGKLLQLETIMYSGFFLTKFVVFWTKKLGMICEINKKSCILEYILFIYLFIFGLKILQKNYIIKLNFVLFLQ